MSEDVSTRPATEAAACPCSCPPYTHSPEAHAPYAAAPVPVPSGGEDSEAEAWFTDSLAAEVLANSHGFKVEEVWALFHALAWSQEFAQRIAEASEKAWDEGREAGAKFEAARWCDTTTPPRPALTVANPYRQSGSEDGAR